MGARGEGDLAHGTPVRVVGKVGDRECGDLRGLRGTVHGVNASYTGADGVERVNIRGEDGSTVSVPKAALKVRR